VQTQDVVITLEGSEKKTSKRVVLGLFSRRCQFSCRPSAASEEPSATDVGFGDFFGVGQVEKSKLRMRS